MKVECTGCGGDCSHSYATMRGDPYHVMCIPPPRSRIDPRDPDYSRPGIFAHHNCSRCKDGADLSRCPTPDRPIGASVSAPEFRAILRRCELSQAFLSRELGVAANTVSRWCTGELAVPRYAVAWLELYSQLHNKPTP